MTQVQSVLQPLLGHPSFRAASAAIATGCSQVGLSGLTRSGKSLLIAALAHEVGPGRPLLVLTADNEAADRLRQATSTFLVWLEGEGAASSVAALPWFDCSPYEGRSPHAEILERRAVALWNAARGHTRILFTPLPAALGRFRGLPYYRSLALQLKVGDELGPEDLVDHLGRVGYEPGEPASSVGLFSLRGGIIDIYPPEVEWPFRLEFFGDQIESLREFDPTTQRSRKPVESGLILPLTECTRSPQFFQALIRRLAAGSDSGAGDKGPRPLSSTSMVSEIRPSIAELEPDWAPGYSGSFPGWEFFVPLVEAHPNSLISLLSQVAGEWHRSGVGSWHLGSGPSSGLSGVPNPRSLYPLLIWDEPIDLKRQLERTLDGWSSAYEEVRDVVPPRPRPEEVFLTGAEFSKALELVSQVSLKELPIVRSPESESEDRSSMVGSEFSAGDRESGATDEGLGTIDHGQLTRELGPRTADEFVLLTQPSPKFHGAVKAWIQELRTRLDTGDTVGMAIPTPGKVERLQEILKEYEVPFTSLNDPSGRSPNPESRIPNPGSVLICRGDLDEGVIFPELSLVLLSDTDLFGGFAWGGRGRREKTLVSSFISDLSDLKVGDYVVHVDHGIGLYHGLRPLEVEGTRRDFMLLTYQDDAKLYVPLERLDLVEKYRSGVAGEGPKPVLDRLGGATWARTKTRVKRALRDMAEELLRLYAQRKMNGGIAYSPDTPWQKEFEDAFEFEETPDQLTAAAEIKRDLESAEPMDRLLCGDVGYGKTELAMRAAFKVVQDAKQVAVLAPTTVLAFQHFNTFRQRMSAFPVRIEMVSRFRTAAETKKILADTQTGKVDILIGTHRLLSKDVSFRELGLLIVDEEQRFGVAAKEKLKKLRANVDVLTMSATPIPRTLHMSLGGLRDLSVIETPPQGRLAIQTTVAPFSQGLIQSAVLQEMARQGQVFFVHNRVESIFSIAALVQRLVPTARIGVGHGQRGERELEQVMLKFVSGEYDVLVSTAIIENGLDIPRANTMVVNRADRFGLSELYQLRGRVGRSDRRAYAYFLIPDEETLTPIAKRRLAALKEFSDLGAGFRLAALDLELRGTGNLLGAEQSGYLNSIGLDLYLKMLDQTVEELKGTTPKPEVRTTLNLGLDIKIPETYISDESQRLRMYKRVSSLSSPEARADLEAELMDRYGAIPPSVVNLLDYALLKATAEHLLVHSLERKLGEVWVRFDSQAPVDPQRLTRFLRQHREASLRPDGVLRFRPAGGEDSVFEQIQSVLQEVQA